MSRLVGFSMHSAIHDCAGCPRPKVLSSELINAHHQHTRVVPPGACDQINFVKELVIATSLRTQAACTLPRPTSTIRMCATCQLQAGAAHHTLISAAFFSSGALSPYLPSCSRAWHIHPPSQRQISFSLRPCRAMQLAWCVSQRQ